MSESASAGPRRPVTVCVAAVLAAGLATVVGVPVGTESGNALVVTDEASRFRAFSGVGCGGTDTQIVPLPASAGGIVTTRPRVGAALRTEDPARDEVARVSTVRSSRSGGRRVVVFTATGSGKTCEADPALQPAWETDFIDLVVRFRRRIPVYMVGTDDRRRIRPAIIYIGASQRIYSLRWRSWGRRIAGARGVFPANSCVPSCAEGTLTPHPVRVTLSQPRLCDDGRYHYVVLRYAFLDGGGRDSRTTFGYLC
jgi:hypothetical protein